MISVHVDGILVAGRPVTLENIDYIIKLKFNIQDYMH